MSPVAVTVAQVKAPLVAIDVAPVREPPHTILPVSMRSWIEYV